MDALGYESPESYIQQVLELFGSFDVNHDGVLDLEEFGHLWEQLVAKAQPNLVASIIAGAQQGDSAASVTAGAAAPGRSPPAPPQAPSAIPAAATSPTGTESLPAPLLRVVFDHFDTDRDGSLDKTEVRH